MPMQLLLAPQPQNNTTPEESIEYLVEFIDWLAQFFEEVKANTGEMNDQAGGPLFEAEQIAYFEEALEEVHDDGHFSDLRSLVKKMSPANARAHGLYGAQLRWKLFNINHSFEGFVRQRTAALFERLLSSIDALLDSILGAVPGGSAVRELKEAVRNSVALVTE